VVEGFQDVLVEASMKESTIEAYLVRRVKQLGGEVRKVQWIGRRGAPDRLVMLPHGHRSGSCSSIKTFFVELKAPGKKPEPHQRREHVRMVGMGQVVAVIDSIEGVEELLR
jgi:hypothetical protein